jgi:hypothetical protein
MSPVVSFQRLARQMVNEAGRDAPPNRRSGRKNGVEFGRCASIAIQFLYGLLP